jgi:rRNA-processing protein FCF1
LEVLLDTSFLLLIFESGRNLIALIEDRLGESVSPIVIEQVVQELKRLSRRQDSTGRLADIALKYAQGFPIIRAGEWDEADEALIRVAKERRVPLVTADWRLMREARSRGCVCIYVNRRLEIRVMV